MRLCQLIHESGKCPTCGGSIDITGMAPAKRFKTPIFPDKKGVWDTDEGPKTAKDLSNKTKRFERVMPNPKKLTPKKRTFQ